MRTPKAELLALTVMLALAACGGYESESGLSAADEQTLIDLGRLREGEHVLYYTSRGEDIEDAGTFFTETRLVAFFPPDEDISIDLTDITALKLKVHEDSWTYADYVTVTWGADRRDVKVYLQSDGEEFPERFYEALRRQWEKAGGTVVSPPARTPGR